MIDESNGKAPPDVKRGGFGRLARGAAGMFTRLPGLGRLGRRDAMPSARDKVELGRRVNVPILRESPEAAEWREIERGFATLADEGLWNSLIDRIRGVDGSRQTFASGRRYFDCALAGALTPVTRHLGPKPNFEAAAAALPNLSSLHVAGSRDHMPAVLLARAKIEIAWALRGVQPPSMVSERSERSASIYFTRAEVALEGFDPIESNSPMVAEARYLLVPGIENGSDYLRDWYEDWADLDPSNPNMLATHSRFLMPDWYGTLDEIDHEARRAILRADDGLGAGAYPLFWRRPLEVDPGVISHVDPDLFMQGVHAALKHYPSQQLTNEMAALLYRMTLPRSSETRAEASHNAPIRERLSDGYDEVIRGYLTELHAPIWGLSDLSLRLAVAEALPEEFNRGAILRSGEKGIEAVEDTPSDVPSDG